RTFKDVAQVNYIDPNISDAVSKSEKKPIGTPIYNGRKRFDWGIAPKLAQTLGNPEAFYLFSVGLSGSASYWITDNLEIG
ncbi:YjbH domain-containing protein, partial [Vibrio parahaemolyticus]|nr:YjbH domain-containing protein [Vibrio parahaemolyticus]